MRRINLSPILLLVLVIFTIIFSKTAAAEATNSTSFQSILPIRINADTVNVEQDRENEKIVLRIDELINFENLSGTPYKMPIVWTLGNDNVASASAEYVTANAITPLQVSQEGNTVQVVPGEFSYLYPKNPKLIRFSYTVSGSEYVKKADNMYQVGNMNLGIAYKPLEGFYPKPSNFDFVPSSYEAGWYDSTPIQITKVPAIYSFNVVKGKPPAKYDLSKQSPFKVKPAAGNIQIQQISRPEHFKLYLSQKFQDIRFAFAAITGFWLAVIFIVLTVVFLLKKLIFKK